MKVLTHYQVSWVGNEHIGLIGMIGAFLLLSGVIMVVALNGKNNEDRSH